MASNASNNAEDPSTMNEKNSGNKASESKVQPDSAEYETVLVSQDGRVATVTLNRPRALNALNAALVRDLVDAVETLDTDPSVGVIVITGSEKAFAAGADIKEMKDRTFPEIRERRMFGELDRLREVDTPIITAVSGYALGGGCELAMTGDIVLASETARFGQPEITLGIIPGLGGTQRLTRAIGKAKAMDLVLTGRPMRADEAERCGLVSRVFPSDSFTEDVYEVAKTVAGFSATALRAATNAVDRAFETTLSEGLRAERESFYSLFATADQKEGMSAFAEKRPAKWQHNQ
ncbi:enoyl-CoA hydratase-related protein [Corynebacterium pseudokroppenstedtii]|uniref:Probable enoyl-CoA hydratase echA8 n=1 Tax=Corynebacterium pseudokroppenstedtii TaxID=2804917 RepID=A0AAU0PZW7_9CORY|nr:enoyl-CoA hydratase-related protein [Corynebacterium pseudokroppenstedtii]MCF6794402.1 enoyl-CoA hydratase-related protein [Corynebacterium pseudokroppenstedtii]MCF8704023.1 enoyl-CoA hydratase-related protein [Corynebacterium pseudokroppenstedtii]MCG2637530.1 enoyl-CoA hydratase-related protein [Corynebacterium pseudokroppenstedtii]MDU6480024.1 enoyl-CoA hydratase-related protein [Corynebacterium kroppenstedtii]